MIILNRAWCLCHSFNHLDRLCLAYDTSLNTRSNCLACLVQNCRWQRRFWCHTRIDGWWLDQEPCAQSSLSVKLHQSRLEARCVPVGTMWTDTRCWVVLCMLHFRIGFNRLHLFYLLYFIDFWIGYLWEIRWSHRSSLIFWNADCGTLMNVFMRLYFFSWL